MKDLGTAPLDTPMERDDETAVSEITIVPDGRVFVLGASRQVLEILEALSPQDAALKQRLRRAAGVGGVCERGKGDGMNISGNSTNALRENCEP